MAADANNNLEKIIYEYPGKAKSDVWKFFGFYKKKDGPPIKENLDMSFAVCKVCRKTYANKGTYIRL